MCSGVLEPCKTQFHMGHRMQVWFAGPWMRYQTTFWGNWNKAECIKCECISQHHDSILSFCWSQWGLPLRISMPLFTVFVGTLCRFITVSNSNKWACHVSSLKSNILTTLMLYMKHKIVTCMFIVQSSECKVPSLLKTQRCPRRHKRLHFVQWSLWPSTVKKEWIHIYICEKIVNVIMYKSHLRISFMTI